MKKSSKFKFLYLSKLENKLNILTESTNLKKKLFYSQKSKKRLNETEFNVFTHIYSIL